MQKRKLPVLGAYPLYNCEPMLSWTASTASLGGFRLPKTVGSPVNSRSQLSIGNLDVHLRNVLSLADIGYRAITTT